MSFCSIIDLYLSSDSPAFLARSLNTAAKLEVDGEADIDEEMDDGGSIEDGNDDGSSIDDGNDELVSIDDGRGEGGSIDEDREEVGSDGLEDIDTPEIRLNHEYTNPERKGFLH